MDESIYLICLFISDIVGENKNLEFAVFKTERNDLKVKHKLTIPEGFCPESQCIEVTIKSPVMKIIPKTSNRVRKYGSVQNLSHKNKQNRTQRRLSAEKKVIRTSSRSYIKKDDPNIINTSIYIPDSICYQSGTANDAISDSSEEQESTTGGKVQSKINKFNALVENMNISNRIQNAIIKSIEDLTVIIFGQRGTSVETSSNSSEDQKSMIDYSGTKVQTRINQFNALIQNMKAPRKIKEVLTKSIDDLTTFIYGQPRTLVDTSLDSSDEQILKSGCSGQNVQSRVNDFNALIQNLKTSEEMKKAEKIQQNTKKYMQDMIVSQPGISVYKSLDSSEHQKSMTDHCKNKVKLQIEKFNNLINNMSASEKIRKDIRKSIADLTNFVLIQPETSVDTIAKSSEDQKSMMDYSGRKEQSKIEALNSLSNNMSSSERIQEDFTQSMKDLAEFIMTQPGTSVDTSSDSLEDQESPEDDSNSKIPSKISKFNALTANTNTSEETEDHIRIKEKQNFCEKKLRFAFRGPCYPTYETVEKYLSVIKEMKDKKDSNIIRQLILQRFKNDLEKFADRNRDCFIPVDKGDSGNDSTCEHCFETSSYKENERAAVTPSGNENFTEASQRFIDRELLELSLSPQKRKSRNLRRNISGRNNRDSYWRNSIGTFNLSDLVSTAYFPLYPLNNHRKSDATYASITDSAEWTTSSTENTIANCDSDEDATKNEEGTRKSIAKFGGETSIISQISKALEMSERCKCSYNNLGLIEAERILLTANLRRMCSVEDISTPVRENIMNERRIRHVRISNIVVPITRRPRRSSSIRFFVFVFRCGSTLLYSDLLWPNEEMEVKTGESFIFKELPSDFKIIFQIYSMKAKISKKLKTCKVSSKSPLQKLKEKIFFIRRRTPRESSKISSFLISGEGYINRYFMNCQEFQINNSRNPVGHIFKCNVDISD